MEKAHTHTGLIILIVEHFLLILKETENGNAQVSTTARIESDLNQESEMQSGSSTYLAGSQLSHHSLLRRMCVGRKLEWEVRLKFKPRGHQKQYFNRSTPSPQCPSLFIFLNT